jgi:predicted nucleic acid-binding protein
MKRVFADTFYFFALLSDKDEAHAKAVAWSVAYQGRLVTTEWVLIELADGLASSQQRNLFPKVRRDLLTDAQYTVVSLDLPLYEQGLLLYEARPDKQWSLTDCISFVTMKRDGINDALTADHHFEQAGFVALLK